MHGTRAEQSELRERMDDAFLAPESWHALLYHSTLVRLAQF
jgi:hypothetical protein